MFFYPFPLGAFLTEPSRDSLHDFMYICIRPAQQESRTQETRDKIGSGGRRRLGWKGNFIALRAVR